MSERSGAPDGSEIFDHSVAGRFGHRVVMSVPHRHNPLLEQLMERVNEDDELYALWLSANVNAVERLGMTDHGPVHIVRSFIKIRFR
jgi:metal-dependent HD superfamily phosphatase/phosphodiesterase